MGLKDVLKKAASLVVEVSPDDSLPSSFSSDPAPAAPVTRTVAETVQSSSGPDLDQVAVPAATVQQPPVRQDGTPDFAVIYQMAGLPTVPFGAEEALNVIGSMPADLPMDVRRKAVGASLSAMGKAMGVTTDSVISDTSRKIAALSSFSDQTTAQLGQYQTMVDAQIAELNNKIATYEKGLEDAKARHTQIVALCEKEGERLDDVLEFFTLDTGASKHA